MHKTVIYEYKLIIFLFADSVYNIMRSSSIFLSLAIVWQMVADVTRGELFTAIVDLEGVLRAEYEVAQDLKAYIEIEEQRINTLKQ